MTIPQSFPKPDDDLSSWLDWMTHWHPVGIDLGLTRSEQVYKRLSFCQSNIPTIVVGGTNGKGSVTAFLEVILQQAGYKTGVYRSPHLLSYNERVRLDNQDATDSAIISGFNPTLAACQETTLSYFEFSTIAALETFSQQSVDIAILEVGLGGRLDVVNIVDPVISIVTNVGIDHTDWLGDDREVIGWEKAHIFRSNRLAICGDPNPPIKLIDYAVEINAQLSLLNQNFCVLEDDNIPSKLSYIDRDSPERCIVELAKPSLSGKYQQNNLACAIAAVQELRDSGFIISNDIINTAIPRAFLPGRLQFISSDLCNWLLDVGHNADAAVALATYLADYKINNPDIQIYGIFGVMKDKDISRIVHAMKSVLDHWCLTAPAIERAIAGVELQVEVERNVSPELITVESSVVKSIESVKAKIIDNVKIDSNMIQPNCGYKPLVVVFGSFYTVGEALTALQR